MIGFQSFLRSFSTTVVRSFSLLTLFTMLAPVVRAQVRFQKPDFDTGKGRVSISVGDFNHDGKLDLAVLCHGINSVSIYLGNGDGSFSHKADYIAGSDRNSLSFDSIAIADFNSDGVLDLAVTNGSTGVSILLGNGDGAFRAGGSFNVFDSASA